MPTSTDPRPVARRNPPWWLVALVQIAGCAAASVCFLIAVLTLPELGFFGVPNDPETRAGGLLAAIGTGAGLVSGPLVVGLVRRDRRWLGWSCAVAATVTALLVVVSTWRGHAGWAA